MAITRKSSEIITLRISLSTINTAEYQRVECWKNESKIFPFHMFWLSIHMCASLSMHSMYGIKPEREREKKRNRHSINVMLITSTQNCLCSKTYPLFGGVLRGAEANKNAIQWEMLMGKWIISFHRSCKLNAKPAARSRKNRHKWTKRKSSLNEGKKNTCPNR